MTRSERRCLLVFGAGSLASEVVRALTAIAASNNGPALCIVIASRDPARARACTYGYAARIEVVHHAWRTIEATSHLIEDHAPDLVFHAASLQSAWDLTGRWGAFVARHGYGVTLPLQLALAQHLQQALGRLAAPPRWVNACFPDLANVWLTANGASGPPPLCGIGNVALIARLLELHAHPMGSARFRLVAAHPHVAMFQQKRSVGESLPLAWLGERSITAEVLVGLPNLPRDRRINAFNAVDAAGLLWALLSGRDLATHAPGPGGLPGGYPVQILQGELTLDLPAALNQAAATAFNQSALMRDGVSIDEGGAICLSAAAAADLAEAAPGLAAGVTPQQMPEALRQMLSLRARWSAPV